MIPELNLIQDTALRDAVKDALRAHISILRELPSSLSGRYHPPDERGPGGFLMHLRKTASMAHALATHFGFSDRDRDLLIAAAFLHDYAKLEITRPEGDDWVRNENLNADHEMLSAFAAAAYLRKALHDEHELIKVAGAIQAHTAAWAPRHRQPDTFFEVILSAADYVVSRENLVFVLEDPKPETDEPEGWVI